MKKILLFSLLLLVIAGCSKKEKDWSKEIEKDWSMVSIEDVYALADKGDAGAQSALGTFYFCGNGIKQDYDEAVTWFKKAAEQGYPIAEYNLGYCYYHGEGVEQDYAEAAKWWTKAAEQGDGASEGERGKTQTRNQRKFDNRLAK